VRSLIHGEGVRRRCAQRTPGLPRSATSRLRRFPKRPAVASWPPCPQKSTWGMAEPVYGIGWVVDRLSDRAGRRRPHDAAGQKLSRHTNAARRVRGGRGRPQLASSSMHAENGQRARGVVRTRAEKIGCDQLRRAFFQAEPGVEGARDEGLNVGSAPPAYGQPHMLSYLKE